MATPNMFLQSVMETMSRNTEGSLHLLHEQRLLLCSLESQTPALVPLESCTPVPDLFGRLLLQLNLPRMSGILEPRRKSSQS